MHCGGETELCPIQNAVLPSSSLSHANPALRERDKLKGIKVNT